MLIGWLKLRLRITLFDWYGFAVRDVKVPTYHLSPNQDPSTTAAAAVAQALKIHTWLLVCCLYCPN